MNHPFTSATSVLNEEKDLNIYVNSEVYLHSVEQILSNIPNEQIEMFAFRLLFEIILKTSSHGSREFNSLGPDIAQAKER